MTAVPEDIRSGFQALSFSKDRPTVLAVSGGGDSMALLRAWAAVGPTHALTVATVDHGLRAESGEEARFVAEVSARLGVRHVTTAWKQENTETGIMAAARIARYQLLDAVAVEVGASVVLTGHTFDDQCESVAMRLERDAGQEGMGLAGIAPATLYRGRTWFVRPLLGVRRSRLRRFLEASGQSWIDDPSNADAAYERASVRGRLDASDMARASRTARSVQAERWQSSCAAARCLADETVFATSGSATELAWPEGFSFSAGQTPASPERTLALEYASRVLGGRSHPLPPHQLAQLHAFCCGPNGKRLTLGGCLLRKSQGRLSVERDPRNVLPATFPLITPSFDWPMYQATKQRLGEAVPTHLHLSEILTIE